MLSSKLTALAEVIADGSSPDWEGAESRASADETADAVTVREQATSQAELLAATNRLSRRVRELLGETRTSVNQSGAAFPKVATSSFHALQLYSQAERMLGLDGPQQSVEEALALLRQAVKEDPEFASAHMLLGGRTGNPAHLERGCALSAQTSGIERLFLTASCDDYKSFDVRLTATERRALIERAAAGYEALLRETPAYQRAHERLLGKYENLGHRDDARRLIGLVVSARPKSFLWNVRAGMEAMRAGDLAGAREYARRAQELHQRDYGSMRDDVITWFKLFGAREAWLQNDGRRASVEVDGFAGEVSRFANMKGVNRRLEAELFNTYLALGRLRSAESHLPALGTQGASVTRLRLFLERGDLRGIRDFLQSALTAPDKVQEEDRLFRLSLANLLIHASIRTGDLGGARRLLNRERGILSGWSIRWIEGELALAEGRLDDAIASLKTTQDTFRASGTLADAWAAKGDPVEAIRVLEVASEHRTRSLADNFGMAYEWLPIRLRLADLYRKTGREADARTVETELLGVLAVADDDHPIKQRLVARAR